MDSEKQKDDVPVTSPGGEINPEPNPSVWPGLYDCCLLRGITRQSMCHKSTQTDKTQLPKRDQREIKVKANLREDSTTTLTSDDEPELPLELARNILQLLKNRPSTQMPTLQLMVPGVGLVSRIAGGPQVAEVEAPESTMHGRMAKLENQYDPVTQQQHFIDEFHESMIHNPQSSTSRIERVPTFGDQDRFGPERPTNNIFSIEGFPVKQEVKQDEPRNESTGRSLKKSDNQNTVMKRRRINPFTNQQEEIELDLVKKERTDEWIANTSAAGPFAARTSRIRPAIGIPGIYSPLDTSIQRGEAKENVDIQTQNTVVKCKRLNPFTGRLEEESTPARTSIKTPGINFPPVNSTQRGQVKRNKENVDIQNTVMKRRRLIPFTGCRKDKRKPVLIKEKCTEHASPSTSAAGTSAATTSTARTSITVQRGNSKQNKENEQPKYKKE